MEKFAYEIEQLLIEKQRLYEKILSVLIEEKAYISQMNIDRIWDTTAKKKSYAMSIEVVKVKLAALCRDQYSGLELEADQLRLSHIIRLVKVSEEKKAELKSRHMAINTLKSDIRRRAGENKRFINDYLSVIDGIFTTMLEREGDKSYDTSGEVKKVSSQNRMINAEI